MSQNWVDDFVDNCILKLNLVFQQYFQNIDVLIKIVHFDAEVNISIPADSSFLMKDLFSCVLYKELQSFLILNFFEQINKLFENCSWGLFRHFTINIQNEFLYLLFCLSWYIFELSLIRVEDILTDDQNECLIVQWFQV